MQKRILNLLILILSLTQSTETIPIVSYDLCPHFFLL